MRRREQVAGVAVRTGMTKIPVFMHFLRGLFSLVGFVTLATLAAAQVKVSLVAPVESVRPGEAVEAALRIEHEPTWHTYWVNAGSGYATSLRWTLPEGWSAGPIRWPVPGIIRDHRGVVTGQGYEGVVLLPVTLTPPADLAAGATVTLRAKADWLMCDPKQCMPGEAEVALTLRVTDGEPVASAAADDFARIVRPLALPEGVQASVERLGAEGREVRLLVGTEDGGAEELAERLAGAHFFTENNFIAFDAEQVMEATNDGVVLRLQVSSAAGDATRLRGVLALGKGETREGWALDEAVTVVAPGPAFAVTRAGEATTRAVPGGAGFAGTLALALAGGLILNLMPCVFPVLGIKVLGVVRQAGNDRRKVMLHGLVFTAGVLASFWALAAGLAVLRAGGEELGGGFQLQSAGFVFALAGVLLVFGLSLSGVFEFGLRATGVGAAWQRKDGLTGSFFTGVLATVVATPCSAPFLAPALGAALALPTGEGFAVFTAIAVGLALPYLLLSLFPQAVGLLPRPGEWMETFKQVMAFPLYATVGYLLWVLAGQTGDEALLFVFFGLTLVAMGVWFYGRYSGPGASAKRRAVGLAGGLALLAAGTALGWPSAPAPDAIVWEEWAPGRAEELRAEGRPVYVDFTARWCATCQTNKQVVFGSEEVRRHFREEGVVALKADWTSADPRITAELARWGRSAVPFNLVYRPGEEEPAVLPELLTPSIVLEALRGR